MNIEQQIHSYFPARIRNWRSVTIFQLLLTLFAINVISPSATIADDNSYATNNLLKDAGAYLKAGNLNQAKEKYLEALAKDSLNQHALKNVGYILSILNDHKNALVYLRRAEKIGKADADTYNLLGVVYAAVGDTPNSLSSYRQAVNLGSENTSYIKNYGAALVTAGRFSDATPVLDSAIKLTPNDGELSFLLGNCYAGLAKPQKAAKAFRAAMELNYDTGDLRYHLGMVSESVGDIWSAEEHYGIGIAKSPENLELRQRLAILYLRSGVYNQAGRLLKDNLSRDPNFINSRIGLGTYYASLGFADSAKAELKKVQRADKGKYEAMKRMVAAATQHYHDSKRKADSASSR